MQCHCCANVPILILWGDCFIMKGKKLKIISLLSVFLFITSLLPQFSIIAKADTTSSLPSVNTYAVLTGDFLSDQGLGDNWEPKNTKTLMKEYGKGIYELTVDFKTAKTYNYKVAFNGQWDKPASLGDNGQNKAIKITSPGKVTFKADYPAGKVYDSINDPDQFKTSATIVGSLDGNSNGGKNWDTTDSNYDLNYIGESTYSKTFNLKAGSYEYKIAYDHKWSNGEIASNVKVTVPKDEAVTFIANPDLGICTDSINTPSITYNLSLIGTVRNTTDGSDWKETAKGYEFSSFTADGKYIYSSYIKAGSYQYKGVDNYSWADGGIPKSGNVSLTVPDDKVNGGSYVIFVADEIKGTLIDSINSPADVATALGLAAAPVTVTNPTINKNGSVTFTYKNDTAKNVYLAGTMNSWSPTATPMTKDSNGNWTKTLRISDSATAISYKFVVDGNWITDPANKTALDKDGNSVFNLPAFTGRNVVLAGDIQAAVGANSWDPSSTITKFTYKGDGIYTLTLKNVKAGNYEYKVAMGSWDENYGANGKSGGDNIKVAVPKDEDITFTYNDDSHNVVDSINYTAYNIELKGTGIPDGTTLQDKLLTGLYKTQVTLNKGTYSDIKAVFNGNDYSYGTINIADASKVVTFSFEPKTQTTFTDLSNNKVQVNSLLFNSRDTQYKDPYGAVKLGTTITFNLQAAKNDLTLAKLVVDTPNGTDVVNMSKNGTFAYDKNNEYDRWTASYKPSDINTYKYYFVVSNGSDVQAYGDSTGYYGTGAGGDIGTVGEYGLNVYDPNFKTPDWMKNAVVYQIFPDRFFNGDKSNDFLNKISRGALSSEYIKDWYSLPECPDLEYTTDSKTGTKTYNPNYKGNKGDGQYSDDYYGGDLKGIEQKLDYLKSLGVNTLYLNPISQSISNHKYDTTEYTHVDSSLGTDEDYAELTKAAAAKGFHIILDGVFNHVSDDSVYFDRYGKYMSKGKPLGAYQYWSRVYDLMNSKDINQQDAEKQVQSYFSSIGITDFKYKDWFSISNTKIAATDNDPAHYEYDGWEGYDSMPIIQHLNGSEINVTSWADEIIDGKNSDVRQWLRNGSSGWRLDAANVICSDVYPRLRQAVKEEGDNVIIGEIWDDASKYLLGNMFDSVTNYRFRGALMDFASGGGDAAKVTNELELIREEYPAEAFEAMLNIAGSHDVERILSYLDGVDGNAKTYASEASADAKAKDKLVPLLQMTYAGAPCIYYGDEAGMVGGTDPDNRRGMIWGKGDKDLVQWYATLANIRDSYPVLRTGDIVTETASGTNASSILAYLRNDSTNHALIALNQKNTDADNITISTGTIPDGTTLTNVLNPSEKYTVTNGTVTINIPKQSGDILVVNYTPVTINTDGLKDAYDSSYTVADRTIPDSDSTVISEIDNTAKNSQFTVSSTDEEVTKSVLDEAKTKSVIPVITRGDTTFTFADNSVIDTIDNAGITGLAITYGNTLTNEAAVEAIINNNAGTNLIKELKFSNNLPDGQFGGKVTISTPTDSKYAGETLYVYYFNPSNNTAELIASPTADKNGGITFDVTHFSDYFVTDKLLTNTDSNTSNGNGNTGNNNNPSNNNTSNSSTASSNTSNSSAVKTGTSKLVQTGSIIDSTVLISAALVLILIGLTLTVIAKRKEF